MPNSCGIYFTPFFEKKVNLIFSPSLTSLAYFTSFQKNISLKCRINLTNADVLMIFGVEAVRALYRASILRDWDFGFWFGLWLLILENTVTEKAKKSSERLKCTHFRYTSRPCRHDDEWLANVEYWCVTCGTFYIL
jgi:hypothetical protein